MPPDDETGVRLTPEQTAQLLTAIKELRDSSKTIAGTVVPPKTGWRAYTPQIVACVFSALVVAIPSFLQNRDRLQAALNKNEEQDRTVSRVETQLTKRIEDNEASCGKAHVDIALYWDRTQSMMATHIHDYHMSTQLQGARR